MRLPYDLPTAATSTAPTGSWASSTTPLSLRLPRFRAQEEFLDGSEASTKRGGLVSVNMEGHAWGWPAPWRVEEGEGDEATIASVALEELCGGEGDACWWLLRHDHAWCTRASLLKLLAQGISWLWMKGIEEDASPTYGTHYYHH